MFALCKKRREKWMEIAGSGSIGVWFSSLEQTRSNSTHFRYRQDSYLFYLLGFDEPETVLILRPSAEKKVTLFVRGLDPMMEIWFGRRMGPEQAQKTFEADQVFDIKELSQKLPELLVGQESLYYRNGLNPSQDALVFEAWNQAKTMRKKRLFCPSQLIDSSVILDKMRSVKSVDEIQVMKKAASIAVNAHKEAMAVTRAGLNEYHLDAYLNYCFRKEGARGEAYETIVGGGDNATILHYVQNDQPLQAGELLLIDAGAEYKGYASDITRTFPVSGTFTPTQKAVYQIVLNALKAGIEECKPGNPFNAPHLAATKVLTQGLIELKVLEGTVDSLVQKEKYKPYYMHSTGHFLGLDVHDVGETSHRNGDWACFEPGMIVTVEPGLYFNSMHIDEKAKAYEGIGIRIEDDILITETGYENLTSECPKEIHELERIIGTKELP